jgi:hypothetical protein
MRSEITSRPVAAQRRLVGAEFDEQIAETGAFASGRNGVAGHLRTVPARFADIER